MAIVILWSHVLFTSSVHYADLFLSAPFIIIYFWQDSGHRPVNQRCSWQILNSCNYLLIPLALSLNVWPTAVLRFSAEAVFSLTGYPFFCPPLCVFTHGSSLTLLTLKPHLETRNEMRSPLCSFLLVIPPFWEIHPFLPACFLLHNPPSDNYRSLFFINEVKSEHSFSFQELMRKTFLWWGGCFNRCLSVPSEVNEHQHL